MPTGNTKGRLTYQPAPAIKKAEAANPPVKVDTPEEKGWGAKLWDGIKWAGGKVAAGGKWIYSNPMEATHWGLDGAGLVPGIGEFADGANALLYLAEGDKVNAALSGAAMIPIAGMGATATKIATKGGKEIAEKAAKEAAAKAAKEAAEKKAAKEAAEKKAAKEGGGRINKKGKKPHKDCGKKGKSKDMQKLTRGSKKFDDIGLTPDHVPSGAAMQEFAMNKLKEMGLSGDIGEKALETLLKDVYKNSPTINIPRDAHTKASETYGGRNNKNRIKKDGANAKSLKEAFKSNTDKIEKDMKKHNDGCLGAYKKAVKELKNFDFDKEVEKMIKDSIKKHGF